MKKVFQILVGVLIAVLGAQAVMAQKTEKIDEERMIRDIEVAENVLTTLIRQQFNNQRMFFALEITGSYQDGYGVTFALPADFTTPIALTIASDVHSGMTVGNGQYFNPSDEAITLRGQPSEDENGSVKLETKATKKRRLDMDSIRNAYNDKVIVAAKAFILDYSDMITQLSPQEKIVITNQGNQPRPWVRQYFSSPKRTHLSVEALRSDIVQYKQNKISREQAIAKIKVINTEAVEEVEPDLELLSTIFIRLYRTDLSKTFFSEGNLYYERLKDFGIIYYMQVFSSIERGYGRYVMPTIGLDDVDNETKNKKVTELYPKFEKELKDNILEYGKTLKSLKDEEVLVFQIKVTQCKGCDIPSTLEVSVKGNVLKEYASGKLDKNAALGKFTLKKGPNQ